MTVVNTPYDEAMRYMENARKTLKGAGKEDGEYSDVKYVQTASGTAYLGVLIALDEYLRRKEGKTLVNRKVLRIIRGVLQSRIKR